VSKQDAGSAPRLP